jgi:transcriptional regulator with XRE-family HTH domain
MRRLLTCFGKFSRLPDFYHFANLLPIMPHNFIPNSLRSRRKTAGLLQSDVARALGLDCADRISHWENGIAIPSVINLFKLAAIYGVEPHKLYPELLEMVQKPQTEALSVLRTKDVTKGRGLST